MIADSFSKRHRARRTLFIKSAGVCLGVMVFFALNTTAAPSGRTRAETGPPKTFPYRIWAACDFEGQTPDYGWFGVAETNWIGILNEPDASRYHE